MQANTLPSYIPSTHGWGQRVKKSEEGYIAYNQVKRKEV